ncbi:MAG TPA: lytic transglycosylase F, partial [Cytophagales bacterium]|nr:lytic transglycosylase F [Cytophagales bacterium]
MNFNGFRHGFRTQKLHCSFDNHLNCLFSRIVNRRKILYISTWVLLGCLLGCRPAPPLAAVEEAEPEIPEPVVFDLQQIQERGEIIALLDNSSTSYFLYKGQPMGYEYELLCLLAKELGVKLRLEIVPDLKDAFIKLNAGEGDVIAHNL